MAAARVLVVDDHLDTLNLFESFLSLSGFAVTPASNGSRAMERARDGFDAVLTDLAMPGIDGLELIRRLRSLHGSHPVPIVVVSGQLADPAALDGVNYCGALNKPCELTDLAGRLRLLIDTCQHQCRGCRHLRGAVPPAPLPPAAR